MCDCFVMCPSVPGNIYYIYPHHHTKFKIIILELVFQTTNYDLDRMYANTLTCIRSHTCIGYITIETKEAGYNGFLFLHEYSGEGRGAVSFSA
jgi:hypothetical protein